MAIPRTYATAGAFRRALEERLKSMSQTEQIDINRLRRQVSFDRLLRGYSGKTRQAKCSSSEHVHRWTLDGALSRLGSGASSSPVLTSSNGLFARREVAALRNRGTPVNISFSILGQNATLGN